MFADPAQAGIARQRAFQHRGGVDEGAVAERADGGLDAAGQLLQAVAHQLVIVATQRVAGDVGTFAVGDGVPGVGIVAGGVIHAQRDHPQRAGHQFIGPRALAAVAGHVVHFAVLALGQPVVQVALIVLQRHPGDADVAKAQLGRPVADIASELDRVDGAGHGQSIGGPGPVIGHSHGARPLN